MKDNKLQIFFAISLLVLIQCSFTYQNKVVKPPSLIDDQNYFIYLQKNIDSHNLTFYLYTDSVLTDSLKFNNIDFESDALLNVGNIWWYYLFSECTSCSPSIENKYQIIFKPTRGKLKVALFSDYKWTQRRSVGDSSYNSYLVSGLPFLEIKKQFLIYGQLTLDSNFFFGKYNINEVVFSFNSGDPLERRGFRKNYRLKYDEISNVFYNEKLSISDTCIFFSNEFKNGQKKILSNEKLFFIKFHNKRSNYAFYQGNWYSVFKNRFMRMDMFIACPNECF